MRNKFFFIFLIGILSLTMVSAVWYLPWTWFEQEGITEPYLIEGDKVFINDDKVFLSAYPHTVSSSQWVYFNLTSKIFSGEIDAVWGFHGDAAKPTKAELYKPHWINWTTNHSETFLDVSTYPISTAPCDYGNEYNSVKRNVTYHVCGEWDDSEMDNCLFYNMISSVVCYDSLNTSDAPNFTANWETKHSRLDNWVDITNKFDSIDYDFQNMTKWYYLKNVNINQDINYQIRAWVDVPISMSSTSGKYFWAIKPSSETISQAISNNHFYYLDPWFNSSWTYKKNITIDHAKVNGTQTNFPVLINITDTDLRDDAQNDGDDIVFTNSTGSKLDYEIEFYNGTTGQLVAWVRIPSLSGSANTTIQMYYGNADAINQENVAGVWDSNFKMVQHLDESPTDTNPAFKDSTSNNNDGTDYGSMTSGDQVVGQIDGSLDFDGVDDYVNCGDVDISTQGTFGAWIKTSSTATMRIIRKTYAYQLIVFNSSGRALMGNGATWVGGDAADGSINLTDGAYHYVVGVHNNGDTWLYVDGILDASNTGGLVLGVNNNNVGIGTAPEALGSFFNGTIDETRISNVARSAERIRTEYNNQYSPSTFYSVGSEESEDTCTYLSGNWVIDCSDNCIITSNVDVGGNNITITGTGTFKMDNGNISNYEELIIQGTDSNNICEVYCLGGCFT